MRITDLGIEAGQTISRRIISSLGGSRHLWMWDWHSTRSTLQKTGFVEIRRCQFGDCEDATFGAVEDPGRFRDAANDIDELAVEARKPD